MIVACRDPAALDAIAEAAIEARNALNHAEAVVRCGPPAVCPPEQQALGYIDIARAALDRPARALAAGSARAVPTALA